MCHVAFVSSIGAHIQCQLHMLYIIGWTNTDLMYLTVQGVIVLHWVCFSICLLWHRGECDFRLGLLQRTGGAHVLQRASDAHIPYYKYISVIKGLFYKSGSFLLFLWREKKWRSKEPKEVLLSNFYFSSSLKKYNLSRWILATCLFCLDKVEQEWGRYEERKRIQCKKKNMRWWDCAAREIDEKNKEYPATHEYDDEYVIWEERREK